MHGNSHSVVIEGRLVVLSDCAHFRLNADGTHCARGFDMATNPCDTCASYLKRDGDPLGRNRPQLPANYKRTITFQQPAQQPASRPEPAGIVSKAASWLKAEASAIFAKLPDDQYEARIAACRQCPQLDPLPDPQVGFCKACGCGKRARAELTVKGRMPAATCPLKKWGS